MKILNRFFGNKIKIVTATLLHTHMKSSCDFVFHCDVNNKIIIDMLKKKDYYDIKKIRTVRSKKIKSPSKNRYRVEEQRIKFYN